MMETSGTVVLKVMKTLEDYPPGLIGTITALFGRCIAASYGVDWTLDVMIAEAQCEFFRRFDPSRDRVWIATENGVPRGAITITVQGPKTGGILRACDSSFWTSRCAASA